MSTVVVVGTGPSGLAAAFELQQAGHQVRMLEADVRVGGKMRSTFQDGFVLDQGAFFVSTAHKYILDIASRAGFADQVEPGGFSLAYKTETGMHELDGKHLLRDFARTRLLSPRAKVAAAKVGLEMRRAKAATFERMPECAQYDTETIDAWAFRTLHPEVAEILVNTTMRAIFGARPDTLSRVEFLGIIALFAGATLVAFRGGMGTFAEAMASRFEVTTDATVIAVEESAERVQITWRDSAGTDHVEHAEGCVLATAGQVTREVHTALDSWRREYLGRIRNGQSWSINMALCKPPAGIDAVFIQVPHRINRVAAGLALDHNKAPGRTPAGKGMVTVALLSQWSEHHVDDADDIVEKHAIDAVEDVLPGIGSDVEFTVLNRWRQEFMPVGHYRELGRFRDSCANDRRIQLAGDHHATPNLNSAAKAGARAAERLTAYLRRPQ